MARLMFLWTLSKLCKMTALLDTTEEDEGMACPAVTALAAVVSFVLEEEEEEEELDVDGENLFSLPLSKGLSANAIWDVVAGGADDDSEVDDVILGGCQVMAF